jgi:hypothetical protein
MSNSVCLIDAYAQVFGLWDEQIPDELFLHVEVSKVLVDVVHWPDFVLLELDEVLHPDNLIQLVFEANLHGHELVKILLFEGVDFGV